MEFLFDKWSY